MLRILSKLRFATLDDYQVPASTQHMSGVLSIGALPDGGFVMTWVKLVSGTLNVVMQIHDRNGHPVGGELVVGPGNESPNAAALPGGGFVVNWSADGNPRGRIYDSTGAAAGAQFNANTTPTGGATQVTALAGGGFVIIWHNSHADNFENIRGQVFAANGTKVGSEFVARDAQLGVQEDPEIIALSGGGFVVAWDQPGADGSGLGLRAQIFDSSGTKLGAAFRLNTITVGTQQTPELAALPGGGFVAVWADDGNTQTGNPNNGNQGVWAQRFDASGNKVGENIHVDAGCDMVDVEVISGVGFAVVWKELSNPSSPDYGHLRIQIFDFDGNRTGEEFSVAPDVQSIQNQPELTALANGGLVVSWQDYTPFAQFNYNPHMAILFGTTQGTEGADVMTGTANRDFFVGLGGFDQLAGGAEDDGLDGGDGADILDGGAGNDVLLGGAGDDQLFGGDGNDLLAGGSGADRMEGGAGADTFRFETAGETRGFHLRSDGKQVRADVIVDFTHTIDKIDLSAIDAKIGTAADDAFTFIGDSAFTNQAGQLRAVTIFGVSTTLFGDIDGDGVADLQIVLNPSVLAPGDFVL